jgi:hypothetical protein
MPEPHSEFPVGVSDVIIRTCDLHERAWIMMRHDKNIIAFVHYMSKVPIVPLAFGDIF